MGPPRRRAKRPGRHYSDQVPRLIGLLGLALCLMSASGAQAARGYRNPVLPGDWPDPSVIRADGQYWATTTSSRWAPTFRVLRSPDLVNWRLAGAVFRRPPAWSVSGSYWAPELIRLGDGYRVFYSARERPRSRRRRGRLCIGVASAAKPAGPYADRGRLVCQRRGSIDPFPVRDERGRLFLIWKEDGNAFSRPTPIWAQALSADATALVGPRRELFRNDEAWEGRVVEGPAVVRRGERFYLFYSGSGCCGRDCSYATGVARSTTLIGRWRKNAINPILRGDASFACPGHGSVVRGPGGRDFYVYHSYRRGREFITGRQLMLDSIHWGLGGWPEIGNGTPSSLGTSPFRVIQAVRRGAFAERFEADRLGRAWEWLASAKPRLRVDTAAGGRLVMRPRRRRRQVTGAVLGRRIPAARYTATALVGRGRLGRGGYAGISLYQDHQRALGIAIGRRRAIVWRRAGGRKRVIASFRVAPSRLARLRIQASGRRFKLSFSRGGSGYRRAARLFYRRFSGGVRLALTAGGSRRASGHFERVDYRPI